MMAFALRLSMNSWKQVVCLYRFLPFEKGDAVDIDFGCLAVCAGQFDGNSIGLS